MKISVPAEIRTIPYVPVCVCGRPGLWGSHLCPRCETQAELARLDELSDAQIDELAEHWSNNRNREP